MPAAIQRRCSSRSCFLLRALLHQEVRMGGRAGTARSRQLSCGCCTSTVCAASGAVVLQCFRRRRRCGARCGATHSRPGSGTLLAQRLGSRAGHEGGAGGRRDRPSAPFRCLEPGYRRELLRVYASNVDNICTRFLEDRRKQLQAPLPTTPPLPHPTTPFRSPLRSPFRSFSTSALGWRYARPHP